MSIYFFIHEYRHNNIVFGEQYFIISILENRIFHKIDLKIILYINHTYITQYPISKCLLSQTQTQTQTQTKNPRLSNMLIGTQNNINIWHQK